MSISNILDKVYPVGSLYITTSKTNPLETLITNSKWELIKEGNTIFTGSDSKLGTYVEAGLPNITGSFLGNKYANLDDTLDVTGCFYQEGSSNRGASGGDARKLVHLDASRSNAIYGKSTTVQPPALYVKIFKRIS